MSPEKELPEEIAGEMTEEEQAALDRELAQMALDAPEMPDDFHARWTEQIRAEAEKTQSGSRTESRRQWRYILSAAAVFVFLIGGTLLTRNSWKKQENNSAAGETRPASQQAVLADKLQAREEEKAPQAVNYAANSVAGNAVNSAAGNAAEEPVVMMAMEEAMDYAMEEEAEEAAPMAAMGEAPAVFAGAAMSMEAGARAKSAAAPAADMAEAATEEAAADMAEAPAESAAEKQEAAKETEEKEEAAPAAEKKEESWFVTFLKDLWTFTVRMRWVLLGALAVAVIVAVVLNKRSKKANP